jgi:hypothetical protein
VAVDLPERLQNVSAFLREAGHHLTAGGPFLLPGRMVLPGERGTSGNGSRPGLK